ncbi:MAG: SDR family NAD(P)-dependent oxidoreductase [Deltaproteobacteria bacterium]|nr:SDR family NAD(P)-dependent oxidoreductase [Deltaproteobacteria bacterium]
MKEVNGKTAFITGGASGIGLGMAKAFVSAGMRVVIADLRKDHLDEAMAFFGSTGQSVHPIALDVADRDAMERAAIEAEGVFGPIHILCNNAGVNIIGPLDQAGFEDWDWLLSVNLGGVINGLVTFIPRMKAHEQGGHIVNTSSIAGIVAGPGNGIYSATKFAIRGLSESLRYDLAPHAIGVSVLCPGTVATNLHQSEENRPDRYIGAADNILREKRSLTGRLFKQVLPTGMDPVEVGEKVLRGICNNEFYIMSHPEFKEEFQESFDEIIAALPDEPLDPQREVFEEERRRHRREARQRADEME